MKRKINIAKLFVISMTFISVWSCADVKQDNTNDPKSDKYIPTIATVAPSSGSTIDGRDAIVITFIDPMDINSVVMSGDMESENIEWTTTINPNDTMTVTPANGIWPIGADQTMVIRGHNSYLSPITTLSLNYTIEYSVPYEMTPGTESTIVGHENIVIEFGEAMDVDSLSVSGDLDSKMGEAKAASLWSSNTLTISPSATIWDEGAKSLTVSCETAEGGDGNAENKPVFSIALDYTVEYVVYVVSAADAANPGDPANAGTRSSPLSVVQDGIDKAGTLYTTADVRVAVGTYQSNYNTSGNPVADMTEGISLYGGYSSNFENRDALTYETILEDTSNSGGGAGSAAEFNRTVVINNSLITNTTILDGFTINGGGGDYACVILCTSGSPTIQNSKIYASVSETGETYGIANSSSPIIQNNYIHGGSGAAASGSVGIYNDGSTESAKISDNEIDGGTGKSSYGILNLSSVSSIQRNKITGGGGDDNSYGIWNSTATTDIINNIIYGGTGNLTSNGIYLFNDNSNILNNTIDGGWCASPSPTATGEYCILLSGTGTPAINNNIMLITDNQGSQPPGYGIYELSATSDPTSVKNNNIYNCLTALYHDEEGATDFDYDQIDGSGNFTDGVNTLSSPTASGNISITPVFENYGWTIPWANADLRLNSSTPVDIKQGGLDGFTDGWGFSNDFTKTSVRTNLADGPDDTPSNSGAAGWSMGAYESD